MRSDTKRTGGAALLSRYPDLQRGQQICQGLRRSGRPRRESGAIPKKFSPIECEQLENGRKRLGPEHPGSEPSPEALRSP